MQPNTAVRPFLARGSAPTGRGEPDAFIRRLTNLYVHLLGVLIALVPMMAIGYLKFFQDAELRFEAHGLYELTSLLAIALGAFITFVTWRCYLATGEVFLRWFTLAYLSFTLIYLPNALLSQYFNNMTGLFIAYGPASRLAMAACFLVALVRLGVSADPPECRRRPTTWIIALCIILAINLGLAGTILTPLIQAQTLIGLMEGLALVLLLAGIVVITQRGLRLSLMITYLLSIAVFAQASIAFMLSDVWSHLWWLAHIIFIAGFLLLSYGVVHAFQITRSFCTVNSLADVMSQLREQQHLTSQALSKLKTKNSRLSQQAATDWLTGVSNRRHFMWQAKREIARAKRDDTHLSLLCLDLDYFKKVNDGYGHQVGDEVLKQAALVVNDNLRPTDLLARVGGEEFHALLPGANIQEAHDIAERARTTLRDHVIILGDTVVNITVSIGCSQLGRDGNDMGSLVSTGDNRLYLAKKRGRDQVVSAEMTLFELVKDNTVEKPHRLNPRLTLAHSRL